MTDHVVTFSESGASCTCGFRGTISEGVGHLTEPVDALLRAAVDADLVDARGRQGP